MDYKSKILDIAMNLNRIGNFAADDFVKKRKRIDFFLEQTTNYINSLDPSSLPNNFKKTFNRFLREYSKMAQVTKVELEDSLIWAEKMMTWGNILTHRSKLLQ